MQVALRYTACRHELCDLTQGEWSDGDRWALNRQAQRDNHPDFVFRALLTP
jgi:hypothetical protein